MLVDIYEQALPQPIYQHAIVPISGTLKHSLRKIALQEAMAAEQRLRTSNEERPLEDTIEKYEQRALLRLSLEQLPAHYRLILILRDFQEMAYQEMADSLALPMGTIKAHILRARHLLTRCVLALALENQSRAKA